MKFVRTDEYNEKLFINAFEGDKKVHQDAEIHINLDWSKNKLRAWCPIASSFLQFPNSLRTKQGKKYIADVIEVKSNDHRSTFFRVVKGSIRNPGSDEVVG